MNLTDFDHTYLINLDKRQDRLEHASLELAKLNVQFERFSAVDAEMNPIFWKPDPTFVDNKNYGWNKYSAALLETTIRLIEDAKKNSYSSVLIFEDDITLEPEAETHLRSVSFDETDWHFFYFGAYHCERPSNYNKKILKLNFSLCLHAYAVNCIVFDHYLEKLKRRDMPIDWVVAKHFHPLGKSYGLRLPIARQLPNFSNIKQADVDYNDLFTDLTF